MESEKKPHFSRWSTIILFISFSKTSLDISPIFLNTETTGETFQQPGKQDSFRHLLKSSAICQKV